MKKLVVLAIVFALAVSCADSECIEVIEVEKSNESVSSENIDAIPIDEALSALDRVLMQIDPPTRGFCRKAGKVVTISRERMFGASSRSASDVPEGDLLYVVNFEKNSGYAILGANNKLDTVIMVGDEGTFDLSIFKQDSIKGGNLNNYFTKNDLYCEEDGEYYIGNISSDNPDEIIVQLFKDYIADRCDDLRDNGSGGNSSTAVTDRIKLLKTLWHQDEPFNLNFHYAPASDTNHPGRRPAGCTTIAAAQIITYLKNLSLEDKFGITTSTWQEIEDIDLENFTINDHDIQDVASMIKQMADGIGVRYNFMASGGTFATPQKVKKYLENIGYNVTKYVGCSGKVKTKIDLSILHGRPVFIAALDQDFKGHAWVIDGLWCSTSQEDYDYVHCNFGWGGSSNGWYVYSVFASTDIRRNLDYPDNDLFFYSWWYRTLIIE